MSNRRNRRLFIVLMLISLVSTLLEGGLISADVTANPGTAAAHQQETLPDWAKQDIADLLKEGIVSGYPDGTFRPDNPITRAEFTALVNKANGTEPLKDARLSAGFADVKEEVWFAGDIAAAVQKGWISGYPDRTFRPEASITREEAAVILARAWGLSAKGSFPFKDSGLTAKWAEPAVVALFEAGVISGYADGTFGGKNSISRAEAAVEIHRLRLYASTKATYSLTVIARDAAGNPLAGAITRVHLVGQHAYLASGKTDAAGTAAFRLSSGEYDVTVSSDKFIAYGTVNVGKDNLSLQLTAEQAAVVSGKVVSTDGSPAAGIVLAFLDKPSFLAVTDRDGKFRIPVIAGKSYHVALLYDSELTSKVTGGSEPLALLEQVPRAVELLPLLDLPVDDPNRKGHVFEQDGLITAPEPGKTLGIADMTLPLSSPQPPQSGGYSGSGSSPGATPTPSPTPTPEPDTTPPAVPTGLSAAAGDGKVGLSWTMGSEADLAGYKVFMSTDGGVTWNAGTDARKTASFTATGLTNGTAYTFAVAAYDASGNVSSKSGRVSATPANPGPAPDTTPPAAPTGLSAAAGDGKVDLSWTMGSEADLAGYKVFMSTDGGVTWNAGTDVGKTASFTATGLTNGTAYTFAVAAYDASGNVSSKSGPVSATAASAVTSQPDPTLSDVAPPISGTKPASLVASTSFLYSGNNPVQTGVAAGTIQENRAAVLRGKVLDTDGNPLSGAQISILDHSEFGTTATRSNGMFDMAVNGGGTLTGQYRLDGYMPLQRQISVPWEDYATLPDVVMKRFDTQVTSIDFTEQNQIQVARGGVETDASGSRQATLLFTPGTTASIKLPDGSTQDLSSLHVRATEYTVGENGPKAMPGELPSFVGYTYAVELSADEAVQAGASEVTFSKPLPFYVENFLRFPVGESVPIGYYDQQSGQWVPSPNGKVIKILDTSGGTAVIDTDGDGSPDGDSVLQALGITPEEQHKLAELYQPGATLWRVQITHFTPWDCNWPYGPPPDAIAPPNVPPNRRSPDVNDPCKQSGSIIGCQEQSLGETIPIAGTPFSLNYYSARTEGYLPKSTLEIPITDDRPLPEDSLTNIEAQLSIGGKTYTSFFAKQPNQTWTFHWDGIDAYGRQLIGSHPYNLKIIYHWKGVYYSSADTLNASFGNLTASGAIISGNRPALDIMSTRLFTGELQSPINPYNELGISGWSLDVHHLYDGEGNLLQLGNGETVRGMNPMKDNEIHYRGDPNNSDSIVIGDEYQSVSFDDSRQTLKLKVAPDGGLYFAMWKNIDPNEPSGSPDNIETDVFKTYPNGTTIKAAAIQGAMGFRSFDAADDGTIYYAPAPDDHRIWRKRPSDPAPTVIAGTGQPGYIDWVDLPEGVPATSVDLLLPDNIRAAPDGTVYFTEDRGLYKIGTNGILSGLSHPRDITSADMGKASGPANKDTIGGVNDLEIGPDGSLYVGDSVCTSCISRIRKISPDGTITTIAGDFMLAPDSLVRITDGIRATDAKFVTKNFSVDSAGNVYFLCYDNYSITGCYDKFDDNLITGRNHLFKITAAGTVEELAADFLELVTNQIRAQNGQNSFDGSVPIDLLAVGPRGQFNLQVTSSTTGVHWYLMEQDYGTLVPSRDGTEVFEFDLASGLHLSTRSAVTGAVLYRFTYDEAGRLSKVTDRFGSEVNIVRDGQGIPTTIVAPNGQRTVLTVNNGALTEVRGPDGASYRMEYGEKGLLSTFTDPGQHVRRYAYDTEGLLKEAQNPLEGTANLQRTYGQDGYTVKYSTAAGLATSYEVRRMDGGIQRTRTDPTGAKTVSVQTDQSEDITYPDGTKASKQYGPDPRWGYDVPVLKSMTLTSPSGRNWTFKETRSAETSGKLEVGSLTNVYTIVDSQNSSRVFQVNYDAAAKTFTETSAENAKTISYLNDQDQVVRVDEQGEEPMTFEYDAKGRLAQAVQGLQYVHYTYDDNNRLKETEDASGAKKQYSYDAAGSFTGITLPSGNTYKVAYDAGGNATGVTMPDGSVYNQSFNGLDQFDGFHPSGLTTGLQLLYGSDGRLHQAVLPGGSQVAYAYDAQGRIKSMNDPDVTRSITYNDLTDRPSTLDNVIASANGTYRQSVSYTYDGADVTSMIWTGEAGGTFNYSYDDLSNLTNISTSVTSRVYGNYTSQTPIAWDKDRSMTRYGPFQFTRNGPGRSVSGITDGKMNAAVTYDSAGRIDSRTYTMNGQTQPLYRVTYGYDTKGLLTGQTVVTAKGTETYAYSYDADGQLFGSVYNGPDGASREEAYSYDVNRNRTSRTVTRAVYESRYGSYDELERVGDVAYSFDANGYLVGRGADTFRYGARGELLTATVTGATYSYVYDSIGRRTARKGPDGTTQYLYGNPTAEQLVTTSVGPNGVVTDYYYGEDGLLLGFKRGTRQYEVITDAVGSPLKIIDDNGQIVKERQYDSYGVLIADTNPDFKLAIGYAGGIDDEPTGLVRFGFRDYDPASGRWTARDPILYDSGQANLFAYVNNNPITLRDSCGLFCIGASAYGGLGGGGKVCVTSDGISACGEAGIGVGGGLEVTPFEDLSKNELSAELTGKLKLGPASLTVGVKVKSTWTGDCLKFSPVVKAKAGPIGYDIASPSKSGVTGEFDKLEDNVGDLFKSTGFKAEAGFKTKACGQLKW